MQYACGRIERVELLPYVISNKIIGMKKSKNRVLLFPADHY